MCNTVGAHVHLSLLLHEGCFGYFTLLWRRHPNLNSCFIKHGQHLLFLVHSCMVIGCAVVIWRFNLGSPACCLHFYDHAVPFCLGWLRLILPEGFPIGVSAFVFVV